MVCVIPLAQTVNRAVGCSPFRQLIAPIPPPLPRGGIGETQTTVLWTVPYKSGLFCGKCATQIHKWTRILVLLNKGTW